MNFYRAICGNLVARTAIHIGSGEGNDVTDDLCRRDAAGNYLIPGTAIGGALRAVATRIAPRIPSALRESTCKALLPEKENDSPDFDDNGEPLRYDDGEPCNCMVCHLFGEINPSEEQVVGRASRLFVAHAKAESPLLLPRIRDGVGIDRASKTSARAAQAKFDLELLPAGAVFELRLELEETEEDDEILLAATLAEWEAGRMWLGGRVARGLGAFELQDLRSVEHDLTNDEGLLAYLASNKPWTEAGKNPTWLTTQLNGARVRVQGNTSRQNGVAHSFVSARFDLHFESLFLTNDTMAAGLSGFDHAPLLEVISQHSQALLPGASLRGALRSQAERIARTLTTIEVDDLESFGSRCSACDPLRRPNRAEREAAEEELRKAKDELAALPKDEREAKKRGMRAALKAPLASCDALLEGVVSTNKEAGSEYLCLACRLFGSTRRGSRLIVEDALSQSEPSRKVLDFLAIDRFTGGGKEGAKFDALALWQPAFSVRLHLENPEAWELGWLALTLRDLTEGLMPVGFGGAKGFGRARVASLAVDYGFISDDDFHGAAEVARACVEPTSGLYRVLTWDTRDKTQCEHLLSIAQSWVDEFNQTRRDFPRHPDMLLQADTYFGTSDISKLYGKEATQWLLSQ